MYEIVVGGNDAISSPSLNNLMEVASGTGGDQLMMAFDPSSSPVLIVLIGSGITVSHSVASLVLVSSLALRE